MAVKYQGGRAVQVNQQDLGLSMTMRTLIRSREDLDKAIGSLPTVRSLSPDIKNKAQTSLARARSAVIDAIQYLDGVGDF
jgi:hypothetical protein